MKIVIISDLHGNYDALSALPESYDELWVLGDLVNYGPQPCEVVDLVRDKATVVARGNHDHAVGYDEDPRCTPRYHEMAEQTRRYSLATLTNMQKEFLRSLPLHIELERGEKRFYLCHAMPSNPLYGSMPSQTFAADVKDMAGGAMTPILGVARSAHMEDVGFLMPLFSDRNEKLELRPLDELKAEEFVHKVIGAAGVVADNLPEFIARVLDLSRGNPGVISSMVEMAKLPKYRSGAQIMVTPLYIDFRLHRQSAAAR